MLCLFTYGLWTLKSLHLPQRQFWSVNFMSKHHAQHWARHKIKMFALLDLCWCITQIKQIIPSWWSLSMSSSTEWTNCLHLQALLLKLDVGIWCHMDLVRFWNIYLIYTANQPILLYIQIALNTDLIWWRQQQWSPGLRRGIRQEMLNRHQLSCSFPESLQTIVLLYCALIFSE